MTTLTKEREWAAKMCGLVLDDFTPARAPHKYVGEYRGYGLKGVYFCSVGDWYTGPQAWTHMGMLCEAVVKQDALIMINMGLNEVHAWVSGHVPPFPPVVKFSTIEEIPTAILNAAYETMKP